MLLILFVGCQCAAWHFLHRGAQTSYIYTSTRPPPSPTAKPPTPPLTLRIPMRLPHSHSMHARARCPCSRAHRHRTDTRAPHARPAPRPRGPHRRPSARLVQGLDASRPPAPRACARAEAPGASRAPRIARAGGRVGAGEAARRPVEGLRAELQLADLSGPARKGVRDRPRARTCGKRPADV
jgi:hypothetical protein